MAVNTRILPLALSVVLLAGCSSARWSEPGTCALIGVGLGTLGGLVYTSAATDRDGEDYAIGIGAGVAGGALLGWGWCALMGSRYDDGYAAAETADETAQANAGQALTPDEKLAELGIAPARASERADARAFSPAMDTRTALADR